MIKADHLRSARPVTEAVCFLALRACLRTCPKTRRRYNRPVMMVKLPLVVCFATLTVVAPAAEQWVAQPASSVPRTADGKPDFSAPPPRLGDGKIDFSGLWHRDSRTPAYAGPGAAGAALSPYYPDVTADMKPEDVPFLPWAREEFRRRRERLSIDDPAARCKPYGVPAINTYPAPFKILHTPQLMAILYEVNTTYRQIFIDGRKHPPDPQPTWMGYSVGRWEGDILIVDTAGFNGRAWLDRFGHPYSEALRVTERFRRPDIGHLEIHTTIDDPKTYTRPFAFTQRQELLIDSELLEHYCTDNEKFGSQLGK